MSVHPFLFPFGSEDRWASYLEHCFGWRDKKLSKARSLLRLKILPILHGPEIAAYMGISLKLVGHMVVAPQKYYRSFKIQKKNGKTRTIDAPRVYLKTVQRYILDCVLEPIEPHKAATGFRKGGTTKAGAEQHVKRPYLWNIDLRDFFPSISKSIVQKVFMHIGYPEGAACFLAGLCCLGDRLPQGAPTSPAISNLVFAGADELIAKLAKQRGIKYTRYADDLTFSGMRPISPEFQNLVKKIIRSAGFSINPAKSRLIGPRCRREVTGLTVNEKVAIPRPTRRNLRACFHQAALHPKKFAHRKEELMGYASWVSQYHQKEGQRYRKIALAIPPEK